MEGGKQMNKGRETGKEKGEGGQARVEIKECVGWVRK